MSRINILRISRLANRNVLPTSQRCQVPAVRALSTKTILPVVGSSKSYISSSVRNFSCSQASSKGIYPETDNPPAKTLEPEAKAKEPTELTIEEYHEAADNCIDHLVATFEELQEAREDVDVEYSAGVLTLIFPPIGTYVINKQPPNKQIWLSSPISGPKRYDWVVSGEAQNQKEGGGQGKWVYLRDGSTLNKMLEQEVGVDLTEIID
ncbi:hypothetical protein VE03_00808 [Pseudogymnoascus sp. 23342-1-I1]|nr:hypothetical protein VE03_00808 [Pseudogymnoascus sp. 23342-1-I1]